MASNDQPDTGEQATANGEAPVNTERFEQPEADAAPAPRDPGPIPVEEPEVPSSLTPALDLEIGKSRAKGVQREVSPDPGEPNVPTVYPGGLDDPFAQALEITREREARTINLDPEG